MIVVSQSISYISFLTLNWRTTVYSETGSQDLSIDTKKPITNSLKNLLSSCPSPRFQRPTTGTTTAEEDKDAHVTQKDKPSYRNQTKMGTDSAAEKSAESPRRNESANRWATCQLRHHPQRHHHNEQRHEAPEKTRKSSRIYKDFTTSASQLLQETTCEEEEKKNPHPTYRLSSSPEWINANRSSA
jgi:hypothetical protein